MTPKNGSRFNWCSRTLARPTARSGRKTTGAEEVDLGEVKELDETEVAEVREQEEVDRSPVQVDTVALGSLYSRFKKKLVERGVREEEVAFIHDARNLVERTALFEKVRAGKIRVL